MSCAHIYLFSPHSTEQKVRGSSFFKLLSLFLSAKLSTIPSMAGGLIELNHGRPQPLQYVVSAAFLAAVYSDYLDAADTPGWYCGPNFYSAGVLRNFAQTQVSSLLAET